jgi:sugar lactone lactonase YvrE
MNPECLWPVAAQVGESPVWVPREKALYFVDIYGDVLHRYHPASGARHSQPAAARLSGLVPLASGGFLASAAHTIGALDAATGQITAWHTVSGEPASNRLNDGKCSPAGRYYTGSMDENKRESSGKLYLMDVDRSLRVVDDGYLVSNGPAFSPDGKVMYHADTTRYVVYRFSVADDGTPSNKQTFLSFAEADGRPDGMITDTDGCFWVAHSTGHRVTRFTPEGKVDRVIRLPVSKVTSMAFGGDDYRTLFITSAKIGLTEAELAEQPLAGALFCVDPGVQGLPAAAFGG